MLHKCRILKRWSGSVVGEIRRERATAVIDHHICRKLESLDYGFVADIMDVASVSSTYSSWLRKRPRELKWRKKRPLHGSGSFKVIIFGTNRKPVCDFLLVNNSNLHPILHRFQDITQYGEGCLSLGPVIRTDGIVGLTGTSSFAKAFAVYTGSFSYSVFNALIRDEPLNSELRNSDTRN